MASPCSDEHERVQGAVSGGVWMRGSGLVAATAAFTVLAAGAAQATIVTSLPYYTSPDWTTIQFAGTDFESDGMQTTLTTAPGRGVWFGYSPSSPPSAGWAPASNADGNYFGITASFSPGAEDWSTYFHDGARYADLHFAPTHCSGNSGPCYNLPTSAGVEFSFGGPNNTSITQFVALDLTQLHTYEFLLRGAQVTYRIDGYAYTGTAGVGGAPILVVGDGSGSSLTGAGAMTITQVQLQTAPEFTTLESLVAPAPEPAAWTMMIGGFGLAGAMLRRRRTVSA